MSNSESTLTGSLEDYLETILRILRDSSVARVRDIAEGMQVSPASVSPAMKRLADMGLVRYSKRSYIQLTDRGMDIATRTATRHRLLSRFLCEILGAGKEQAEADACAMEHHLSEGSMERLAAFFEFLAACPDLGRLLDSGFGSCLEGLEGSSDRCSKSICPLLSSDQDPVQQDLTPLSDLQPGKLRRVARVSGSSGARRSLIDMGFIEGTEVTVQRPATPRLPCIVILGGYRLELPREMTAMVLLHPEDSSEEVS